MIAYLIVRKTVSKKNGTRKEVVNFCNSSKEVAEKFNTRFVNFDNLSTNEPTLIHQQDNITTYIQPVVL